MGTAYISYPRGKTVSPVYKTIVMNLFKYSKVQYTCPLESTHDTTNGRRFWCYGTRNKLLEI